MLLHVVQCGVPESPGINNKKKKTQTETYQALSAGNAKIPVSTGMVSSGVDDNIILLPSPDVQPGFDPLMGVGGVPHTVEVQQEQRVQPAQTIKPESVSTRAFTPWGVKSSHLCRNKRQNKAVDKKMKSAFLGSTQLKEKFIFQTMLIHFLADS